MKVRKQLAAAACCAAVAIAVLPAAGASAASAAAAAPKPGTWTRLTATGLENIEEVGLARGADGVLHVLWTAGTAVGHVSMLDTPIAADGAVGRPVTIAAHFDTLAFAGATTTPGGVDAFWNGGQTPAQASQGTYEATRPLKGGAWHFSPAPTPVTGLLWGENLSAATGADGKPWVTFTAERGVAVLHFGQAERVVRVNNCCQRYPDIGVDGKTHQAWLTYANDATGATGTYFVPLSPSGTPTAGASRDPGSVTGGNARETQERVPAVSRGAGRPGVYTTYLSGYPDARAVDLYRFGAKSATAVVRLPALNQIGLDTLTADPQGRLWIAWANITSGAAALWVRRSNAAVSAFGPTVNVRLPAGTDDIWRVYLSAQSGRLDVVALLTVHGAQAYWSTQVLPPK